MRTYAVVALMLLGPLVLGAPAPHDPTFAANNVPTGSELFYVRAGQLSAQAREAVEAFKHPATLAQSAITGISQAEDNFSNAGSNPVFK